MKSTVSSESIRVLIAEDSDILCETTQKLLTERGYEVVGRAVNGIEAIEMVQTLVPDVVLMDIGMPDMDGLEASDQIQRCCPTPIVVLTAHEDLSLVRRAAQVGVGAYLIKPPSARELEHAIVIARARFASLMEARHLATELHAANEELSAFSQTVAHDLRHFLSPILGYAEVLYEEYGTLDREVARKGLRVIMQTARDMDDLIDDLLFLAQVRQEDVPLEPVAMGGVVQEALRRLDYLVQQHGAQVQVAEAWPSVLGYAPWLVEVWVNYLSNAVKYGGEAPVVELGWSEVSQDGAPSQARFWVKDHGIGIAPKSLPYIFDAFCVASGDVGREGPRRVARRGHGLGLSIVRRIVEKLEGEVDVESEEGTGSTFSFTLPIAPA